MPLVRRRASAARAVARVHADRQRARRPRTAPSDDPSYPLAIVFCPSCTLVQLGFALPAERIFDEEYPYFSSFSDALCRHAAAHVDDLIAARHLGPESFAVEVASNDGYLLRNFVAAGIRTLGIDPSPGPAAAAEAIGVPTIVGFFGERAGRCDARRARRSRCHRRQQRDGPRPRPQRLRRRVRGPARRRRAPDDREPVRARPHRARRVRHDLPRALLLLLVFVGRRADGAPRAAPQRRRVLPGPPRRHAPLARRQARRSDRSMHGVPRRRASGRDEPDSTTTVASPHGCASASRRCGRCSPTSATPVAPSLPTAQLPRARRFSTAPASAPTWSPTSSIATCTSRAS